MYMHIHPKIHPIPEIKPPSPFGTPRMFAGRFCPKERYDATNETTTATKTRRYEAATVGASKCRGLLKAQWFGKKYDDSIQGGPLSVIPGVITPISRIPGTLTNRELMEYPP